MRVQTPYELGLLVRERRHDLRLTQQMLAERAGVGRQWLASVEGGHPRAELGKLLALFAALDLTFDLVPTDAGTSALEHLRGKLRERDRARTRTNSPSERP